MAPVDTQEENVCTENMSKLECEHTKLIQKIRLIQNNEKFYYEKLEKIGDDETKINPEERNEILKNIKDLKKVREGLMDSLKDLYSEYSRDVNNSSVEVTSGVTMVKMVDEEIKQLEHNLNTLRQRKRNQERMAEVGNYEQKRYAFRIQFLRVCTYALVGCFAVMALQRLFLPVKAAMAGYVIVLSLAGIKLGHMIYDGYMRDAFYFDKYNWPTNKEILQPNFDFDSSTNDEYYEKLLDQSQCNRRVK